MLGWDQSQLAARSTVKCYYILQFLCFVNLDILQNMNFKSKYYLKYILILGLQELCDAYYLSRREYYFDRWFDPPFNKTEC